MLPDNDGLLLMAYFRALNSAPNVICSGAIGPDPTAVMRRPLDETRRRHHTSSKCGDMVIAPNPACVESG
jgi:hypothetical protein